MRQLPRSGSNRIVFSVEVVCSERVKESDVYTLGAFKKKVDSVLYSASLCVHT